MGKFFATNSVKFERRPRRKKRMAGGNVRDAARFIRNKSNKVRHEGSFRPSSQKNE